MPANLASKLLQQRFQRDRELSWKLELVKRRDMLAKAEQEAQVATSALTNNLSLDRLEADSQSHTPSEQWSTACSHW
jgi:hypothetical protein